MRTKTLEDFIKDIQKKFKKNRKSFEPYINTIRFPKYKCIKKGSKINFSFPLTVLVGTNGCNKTSVLQAIYGVPKDQSVSDYWFSTDVDKIVEEEGETNNCLAYTYIHQGAQKEVGYVKRRSGKAKGLDYWESARPTKKYGFNTTAKELDEELKNAKNKLKTRWDPIEKNTIFCDFKSYVSAYDLCFYHSVKRSGKNQPQNFIRKRAKHLSDVVDKNRKSYYYYVKDRVARNECLSKEKCKFISEIIGETYEKIRIVEHRFYVDSDEMKPHKTIMIKKEGMSYTEAFAGSGESRVILMVDEILDAKNNSLILLDEPEINLHPSAIIRLKCFLLRQILEKGHQIVLTTHSHYLVDKLPNTAIKLFKNNGGEISIYENVEYEDAFLELGEDISKSINIFVEDKVSKAIVDKGLERYNVSSMKDMVDVRILQGGAQNIIGSQIYSSVMRDDKNSYYILDGDQNKIKDSDFPKKYIPWINNRKIDADVIPISENKELANIIKAMTGMKIKFKTDTNIGDGEIYELERKFINFWRDKVLFLNLSSPELAILDSYGQDISKIDDGKEYYKKKAQVDSGSDKVTSEDILYVIKRDINKLKNDCDLNKIINDDLTHIWENMKGNCN